MTSSSYVTVFIWQLVVLVSAAAADVSQGLCQARDSEGKCLQNKLGSAMLQRNIATHTATIEAEDDSSSTQCAEESKIRFATWNIQNFGKTKAGRPAVMTALARIIAQYDVIVIQELSQMPSPPYPCGTHTADAICSLLDQVNGVGTQQFNLTVSPRIGDEQYALMYNRQKAKVIGGAVYPDAENLHSRPPYAFEIEVHDEVNTKRIVIASSHVKPDEAVRELNDYPTVAMWMERTFANADSHIIAGDFNADGSYFKEDNCWDPIMSNMPNYCMLTDNSLDTTVATSSNTYDRIIASSNLNAQAPYVEVPETSTAPYIIGALAEVVEEGCGLGDVDSYLKAEYCDKSVTDDVRLAAMKTLSDHYPVAMDICLAGAKQGSCAQPAATDLCKPKMRKQDDSEFVASSMEAGDCEVVGFQSKNPDDFAVVMLKGLPKGERVFVTDKSVDEEGRLTSGEGVLAYQALDYIEAGTVLMRDQFSKNGGRFALAEKGDQIIVYAGSLDHPQYLCALTTGEWEDVLLSADSAIPPGLEPGKGAIAIGAGENGYYMGDTTGSIVHLRNKIIERNPDGQLANWAFDDGKIAEHMPASFHIDGMIGDASEALDTMGDIPEDM